MDGPTVLTTIHTPPKVEDFTPIAEHQTRTPETFFGGRPVLHYHAVAARAYVPASQRRRLPVFRTATPATAAEAGAEDDEEQLVEQTVDVFVNSETFTIFSQDATCGVQIPYPLIGIHAVKHIDHPTEGGPAQCVYMQLDLQDGGADDETFDTVELTIFPPTSPSSSATPEQPLPAHTTTTEGTNGTSSSSKKVPPTPAEALFAAISACADLHPDPESGDSDGDEDGGFEVDDDDRIVFEAADGFESAAGVWRGAADGGLPPPLPGSSGWITAENMDQYFDADGNWIGDGGAGAGTVVGELGEGAGRVRAHDEVEGDDARGDDDVQAGSEAATQSGVNGQGQGGAGEDSVESKRLRTA